MNFWRISGIASKILFYALGILLIYWLLLKITGHSPTSDQITTIVLSFLLTAMAGLGLVVFRMMGELREMRGEFRQFAKHAETEFNRINTKLDR
jgi:hypothetical protein